MVVQSRLGTRLLVIPYLELPFLVKSEQLLKTDHFPHRFFGFGEFRLH